MTQPTPESQPATADAVLTDRVTELEIRAAFLDDVLEQLQQALIRQDRLLRDQQDQLRLLYQQLQQVRGGEGDIEPFDPASNVPPHY